MSCLSRRSMDCGEIGKMPNLAQILPESKVAVP
jgi:hypothetical protein